MLRVCACLAVTVICVLGDPLKNVNVRKQENLSNLQLLLPIQFLKQEPAASREPAAGEAVRPRLRHHWPYSRIPADQFTLDDTSFLFDTEPRNTVKKDLSQTKAFSLESQAPAAFESEEGLPTELAESCLNYLLQNDLAEYATTGKPTRHDSDHNLLFSLCKKYLGTVYVKKGQKPKERMNDLFIANLDASGKGGLAGNVGLTQQRLQSAVKTPIGLSGSLGFPRGRDTSDVHGNAQGHFANTLSGFIDSILTNVGIANMGVDGQGGYAGNIALDGVGAFGGNVGVNGVGGLAGNAAYNGLGKAVGNIGLNGKGGQAGNLGVGGKGGLFGNLGIGGQGGFYGNVGIGSGGNQFVDLYTVKPGNLLEYLLARPASQKVTNAQSGSQYLSGHIASPKEIDLGALTTGVQAGYLDHVPAASSAKPPYLGGLNEIAASEPTSGNTPTILDTASSNLVGFADSNTEIATDKAIGGQDADNAKAKVKEVGKDEVVKGVGSKSVARQPESQGNTGCLVGALAMGGRGQVGNLAVSGGRGGGAGAGGCGPCIHLYLGSGSGPATRVSIESARRGAFAEVTPLTPPNKVASQKPSQAQTRSRPTSGRRGWMRWDRQMDPRLRHYISSKKTWTSLH